MTGSEAKFRGLKALFKRRDGNVAMSFALVLIPLLTIVGMALDFSRAESSANQVQYALDGAVLAAARAMQEGDTDSSIQDEAQKFFDASIAANSGNASCGSVVLSVDRTNYGITGTISCTEPTTLSGLIGINQIEFTREARTEYGVGKLDVVFMFDTSGSMGSSNRMNDLQDAAKDAVKTILATKTKDKEDVRIAISTYATSVNVGEDYFKAVTDQDPDTWECSRWKWKNGAYRCQRWKQTTSTCVTGREGTHKYTDAAPGNGAWIGYETTDCNSATLTPLTWNQGRLISAIETLPTSGSTAGHLGIAWAWYLISPKWTSIWPSDSAPKAYDDPDTTKVAILMTDGEFNVDYMSNGGSFDHAKKFCDAMKAEGIQIFTVAFNAPRDGEEILSYCASNAGQFFAASNGDELTDAYQKIATSVTDLRITH